MLVAVAVLAAATTGALVALLAFVSGVGHTGILAAIAVIAACLQMLLLMLWYLRATSKSYAATVSDARTEPRAGAAASPPTAPSGPA